MKPSWRESYFLRWHECREKVRFSEVDAFDVVWHGHYIKYFEIGRLDLSGKYSLTPEYMKQQGYFAPVVDLGCTYKEPARLGDEMIIRTTVEPSEKAALTFRYEIVRASDEIILAKGYTAHVLLTLEGKMIYSVPDEIKKPVGDMLDYCND